METRLVTAAYTIPREVKQRIERESKLQDLNASQLVRRIFADYYSRVDAASIPLVPRQSSSHRANATNA